MVEVTPMYTISPKIYCLVGPSGSGKTTILRAVVKRFQSCKDFVPLREIVSTTTRQPRPGEVEGVDYFFLDDEQAKANIDSGAYIEHVTYHGNTYGFLRSSFEEVPNNHNIICIVERNGLVHMQEEFGLQLRSVLILPPDREELVKRLRKSGRRKAEIEKRLTTIDKEMDEEGFDHVIVNDKLDDAVGDLYGYIRYTSTRPESLF